MSKSSKRELPCAQCGAKLLRFPSQARTKVYCNRTCLGLYKSAHAAGANAANWGGGTRAINGYIVVYAPWAACADIRGNAYLHRLIVELRDGRPIPAGTDDLLGTRATA